MNKSLLVAAAVTALMTAACSSSPKVNPTEAKLDPVGECNGINSCKAKGECGGAGHACAGKNSCKGQGWVKLSKSECEKKSGKFKADL